MMKFWSLFPALLAAGFAACVAPAFSVEPSIGILNADGDLAVTSAGNPVVRNSLGDLGIDGDESAPGVRADLKWGMPHITLETQSADWSGSGSASNFGGIPGANVAVDSDLEIAVHRGLITFDFVPTDLVEVGLGLGVSVLDIEASVSEQGNPANREDLDEVLPIPVIAVRAAVNVWRFEFEALVTGVDATIDGNHAAYYDTDVAARFRLFGVGPVDALLTAGYRRIDVDARYDDGGDSVRADFTFDGPYVGLRVSI